MALIQRNQVSAACFNPSRTRPLRKGEAGFALVATMVMLPLLAVLTIGLLTLSSVSLRSESRVLPMKRAQANARMALMLALGEMQKNLGPDQRVSGDARVATDGASDPEHRHWVSVWKTTREDEKPWIVREGENGGLRDVRQNGTWEPRRERIAVLVSGNERTIVHDDDKALDDKASVTLVGNGSLGKDGDKKDEVKAPLVSITKGGKPQGGYAWWVGDLGARANIATADGAEETQSKYHPVMLAQDASWQVFGDDEIPNDARSIMVSEPQIGLFDKDYKGRNYHDLTVWSEGLPVDVRDGGWKKDLTAFIESEGSVGGSDGLTGLEDQDRLVGPANEQADRDSGFPGQASRFSEVSPRFGLIRKWARRADSLSPGMFTATSELGDSINYPTGGGNAHSVDIYKRTNSHVMPVLVEGSMYYNLSYYTLQKPVSSHPYGLRVHFYPRVVLWNPYNFRLRVPDSAIFMHINGAKFVEVTLVNNQKRTYRMFWGTSNGKGTGGSARGGMYFKMTGATIEPGESLVWSPTRNTAYNESSFAQNLLSPSFAPSPTRSLYMDSRGDGDALFKATQTTYPLTPNLQDNVLVGVPTGWREVVLPPKAGSLQGQAWTQADDYFMSWKPYPSSTLTAEAFRAQPMGRFISCAYQLGDEDEMPVEWTSADPVPMPLSSLGSPSVTQIPDRRTRDGFRLRWLQEPLSNVIGSGSLAGKSHLEESAIGNWNLRGSWAFRTPFENVTDVAPNFFGIYTRDLFDGDVDWTSMNPRVSGGTVGGDPFDQPVRSPGPRILFDSPRKGAEVISLGALQHVNFSEFIWHPTYALGNSLADPRIPMTNTEPPRSERLNKDKGGWNQDTMGYATDGRSGNDNGLTTDADNWAWHARNMLKPVTATDSNIQTALTQTLVYDLSYELNHSLWDAYFLSSGTTAQRENLLNDGRSKKPLPNGRVKLNKMAGVTTKKDITDFNRAASRMVIDGAFNVNSTSVEAWESLLLSSIGHRVGDSVAFSRILDLDGGDWNGKNVSGGQAWSGQRTFDRAEIRRLAEEIVNQVRLRGPFMGLSDFVNRRLSDDDTGKMGALQSAIDRAGLNSSFTRTWPLNNTNSLPDFEHKDHIADPTRIEQTLKPDTTAWGALGFLTQADLLQFVGPALSGRSDTFRIRAYGESRDAAGKIEARAWCEAVIQRTPFYVDRSDDMMLRPASLSDLNKRLGRRFEMVSFRWLKREEI